METKIKNHLAKLFATLPAPFPPTGPYFFRSGKYEGVSAETLMLRNYGRINFQYKKMISKNDARGYYFNHLNWLMRQGENRIAKAICPWCEYNSPVIEFFVVGDSSKGLTMSPRLACCGREECEERIKEEAGYENGRFYPVCFSSIAAFEVRVDRDTTARLLRKLFGIPDRATPRELFEFFQRS
jgi:hypothetical protein